VPQLDPEMPIGAIWAYAAENSARNVLQVEADLFAAGYNPDSVFWEMIFTGELDTPEAICDWWFKAEEFPLPTVFAFTEWNPKSLRRTSTTMPDMVMVPSLDPPKNCSSAWTFWLPGTPLCMWAGVP